MVSSQPIQLVCPACKTVIPVDRQRLGQRITCSSCLEEFVAPPAEDTDHDGRRGLAETAEFIRLAETTEFIGPPPSLESQPQSATGNTPPAAEPDADYEFDVECPLCGTRQDATREQIGLTLRCPDCDFLITVNEPSRRARRLPGQRTAADEEIRLRDASAAKPMHALAHEFLKKAESEVTAERLGRRTSVAPVPDTLPRGRAARNDDVPLPPPLPARPLRNRVLRFLLKPPTLIRSLILGIGLLIELAAIRKASELFFGDPFAQFLCVMLLAFSAVFGFALFLSASITLLTVLQDTAVGKDVIEDWPEGYFLDWFADSLYMVVALFIAAVPGVLAGRLVAYVLPDMDSTLLQAALCAPTVFILFPFLLLSLLETGSPLNIVSRPIWRSLSLIVRGWLQFYFWSALLAAAGFAALLFAVTGSLLTGLLSMVAVALLLLVYFRLLGRLAWWCREVVAEADQQAELAKQAEGNGDAGSVEGSTTAEAD